MTETEHLLVCLSEECNEVSHAIHKALRFGLKDKHPKRGDAPNDILIREELEDLLGVIRMLQKRGVIAEMDEVNIANKAAKVEQFMGYAYKVGTLT